MARWNAVFSALVAVLSQIHVHSWQIQTFKVPNRRQVLQNSLIIAPLLVSPAADAVTDAADLSFAQAPSGLQYADFKVGTGSPITENGSVVSIDYVMSTTGARYGSKIYSTAAQGAPYRWKLGDGTTIAGLEQAVMGAPGVPPMQPGGIRRVIIPASLAYESLARPIAGSLQYQDCQEGKGVGPIPPTGEGNVAEYYQRFKNIYCNANRPYQPDLVMDIKLYGKR